MGIAATYYTQVCFCCFHALSTVCFPFITPDQHYLPPPPPSPILAVAPPMPYTAAPHALYTHTHSPFVISINILSSSPFYFTSSSTPFCSPALQEPMRIRSALRQFPSPLPLFPPPAAMPLAVTSTHTSLSCRTLHETTFPRMLFSTRPHGRENKPVPNL